MTEFETTARTVRVALVWHAFGHDNLGVDALSRANATIISAAAARLGVRAEFVTLGSGQKPTPPDLPENVTVGPRLSFREPLTRGRSAFLSALRSCDVAVDIGEGDSFTDIYGRQRFAFLSGIKAMSVLFRQPLVLAPQTIGPFEAPIHRRIAAWLMSRATAVFTRDPLSTACLDELGVTGPRDEFIDVAFRLPFEPQARRADNARVGVNVSGLLYNQGYTGQNELGMALDYKELTHRLIEHFLALPNVSVELFAHVGGGGGPDDDLPVIAELGRRYPAVSIVDRFATSVAAKSWISGLDFVIAGRMHACIAAFSSGVPVAPVAYSRKFNGLFGALGYRYFVDGKTATTDQAARDIGRWFDERAILRAALEDARPVSEDRLQRYEDRMVEILTKAIHRKA